MKKKLIILLILIFSIKTNAQFLQVNAEINRNNCLIGDQLTLKLTLSKPLNKEVLFPQLNDTITSKIEIIKKSKIDTIAKENQQVKLQQSLIITSFDTGLITIPPLHFLIKNDSLYDTISTNPILFTVNAMPVDTTKQTIYDIKPPLNEPFTWDELLNYLLIGLAAVLLIAIAVYVYFRIKNKKPIIPKIQKPDDPPYVVALNQLNELKEKKLWQKQMYKQYYSELTDIIRIYLEKQFQIPAMESLSSEIIDYLKQKSFEEELVRNMQSLLTTADFVKFAKATPLPDENDWHWKNAVAFVEKTKPSEVLTDSTNQSKGGVNE